MKKSTVMLIFMCILCVLCIAYFVAQALGVVFPWQEQKRGGEVSGGDLEIHMIDVGQGDCILIKAPEGNMLIDAGDKSNAAQVAIQTYLEDADVKDFEYVVFTHSDADHIGAADYVMENYQVDNVIMTVADERTTVVYKEMMTAIEENGAKIIDAEPGNTYSIGEMEFEILAPIGDKYSDVNDYSVVLRIDYGESSFLMTGDAEKDSEKEMVAKYSASDLDCDVLKAGHHGSRTSSSEALLGLVTPEVVLISCGEGNKYGHPHSEVLDRFVKYANQQIFRTDELGDIVITTDGEIIRKGDLILVDESGN
ncbi:MAG: MBL fold metallo-hydrolase [Clostridia bacterium]|nr:MBL fold metallo-hydrolase [Clostridia bacterium]